jgi:hypothetical protein
VSLAQAPAPHSGSGSPGHCSRSPICVITIPILVFTMSDPNVHLHWSKRRLAVREPLCVLVARGLKGRLADRSMLGPLSECPAKSSTIARDAAKGRTAVFCRKITLFSAGPRAARLGGPEAASR